ncbi:MAG: RHS repeat protein, partial [Chloroflexi bacterium]|nr:RHS repeat protein [Chloroflexota bacterium]
RYYLADPLQELVYTFDKLTIDETNHGVPRRMEDRRGNALTFTYEQDAQFRWFVLLTRVEDGLGRRLDLTWEKRFQIGPTSWWFNPHVSTVTDQAGRTARFQYTLTTSPALAIDLSKVTDTLGRQTTFSYTVPITDNVVVAQTLPCGNVPYRQSYARTDDGSAWQVVAQTDAYSATERLAFGTPVSGTTTITDELGYSYRHTYADERRWTGWEDEVGNDVSMGYDSAGRRTSSTDRLGAQTLVSYHAESGKVASITNSAGATATFVYTARTQGFGPAMSAADAGSSAASFTFWDLTRINYPDGTCEQAEYDERGNLLSLTERRGGIWNVTYNARGQPLTIVNPPGGVVTYTYNADATVATWADSDGARLTYGYDAYKRVNRVTHPAGSFSITYDLADQITSLTDERGNRWSYEYDLNGNLTRVVDPDGRATTYSYDAMDRQVGRTDRRGKLTQYGYDAAGQLTSITDANGLAYGFAYDPRGWLEAVTDPAGQVWQAERNAEGLVTSVQAPLGDELQAARDSLGWITALTNGLDQTVSLTRDAAGNVRVASDPLGGQVRYRYEPGSLLSGVTLADGRPVTYTYNALGLLAQVTDLAGSTWTFDYTPMGRLSGVTDPLGQRTSYRYEGRGLVDRVSYPGGETETRSYDANGNLTRRQFSSGLDLRFGYDRLNRLTEAEGIQLGYNEVGQVASTRDGTVTFAATYDDGGRLRTVTYGPGLTVTYEYETRGLLRRVSDNLSGAWVQMTYDANARLVGVQRSSGLNATLGWDAASRLVSLQEDGQNGSFSLGYTYDDLGRLKASSGALPLDPLAFLEEGVESFSHDAAGQLGGAGYAYDTRGRQTAAPGCIYAWDGASRLVQADGVQLTYNGLGDLRTRRAGGKTVHFYYNQAIAGAPIVAERDESSGQWLRYYVFSANGELIYLIDAVGGNKPYFYHFDRQGSTLALSDASGSVSDAYAYDPYGRLLGHAGTSAQMYTFVGMYGVRQEGADGLLYHMRARYYDAQAGRFLSREPLWPRLGQPADLNPYAYAGAQPTNGIDPTGLCWGDWLRALLAYLEQQYGPYYDVYGNGSLLLTWPQVYALFYFAMAARGMPREWLDAFGLVHPATLLEGGLTLAYQNPARRLWQVDPVGKEFQPLPPLRPPESAQTDLTPSRLLGQTHTAKKVWGVWIGNIFLPGRRLRHGGAEMWDPNRQEWFVPQSSPGEMREGWGPPTSDLPSLRTDYSPTGAWYGDF